jgi:UDP-glucose 4-epimerase
MTYLVTGGAGFIGSHIVRTLLERGERVRVLDNFATGKRGNLTPLLGKIEVIEGDIRYLNNVQEATHGADYVLHLAALPSVARSVRTPIESNDVNVHGTVNLLIAARDAGVKRVVYAASSSAYGNTEVLPKVETMPSDPLSPYAVNKLAGELYCRAFTRVYGLEAVSLRYFNVFGPRQDPSSQYSAAIPRFIQALLADQRPTIYGDGEQSRDFTYVQNVVEASLLACRAPGVAGETINVACGERITLNQLVEMIGRHLGKKIQPSYEAPRAGDVRHSLADIRKAETLLKYRPSVGMEEGVRRTIEWLRGDGAD